MLWLDGGAQRDRSRHIVSSTSLADYDRGVEVDPLSITPGRNIDWKGELAIIVGKAAYSVSLEQAQSARLCVTIEIEGIGSLKTPKRAATMSNQ